MRISQPRWIPARRLLGDWQDIQTGVSSLFLALPEFLVFSSRFLIGTFCYETTQASGYHAWPRSWSVVSTASGQRQVYLSKEAGEGLSAPPWWQLENRVWLSVPAGGLDSATCPPSWGWTGTFHHCTEHANQSHFLHAERSQAAELAMCGADCLLQQDSRSLECGFCFLYCCITCTWSRAWTGRCPMKNKS